MRYLIDSNWIIDNLLNVQEAVDLLDKLSADGIAVSIITYMEVYEGTLRAQATQELRDACTRFFANANVLAFTPAVARRCATLRQELRRQGKRVNSRALDLCIAATALEHNLEFVSNDRGDYDDIPGLTLYRP
ncbi:MAG: type II toxin-antitoxin system VapC family toxin [Chloroflexota bacterium]|nr:type II toxin-antitoxin system VapC family toxin [Chloroflexota bacterium]